MLNYYTIYMNIRKTLIELLITSSLLVENHALSKVNLDEFSNYTSINSLGPLNNELKISKRKSTTLLSVKTAISYISQIGRDNVNLKSSGTFYNKKSQIADGEVVVYQNGNIYIQTLDYSTKENTQFKKIDELFKEKNPNNYIITELSIEDLNQDGYEDISINIVNLDTLLKYEITTATTKIRYFGEGNGNFKKYPFN